MAIKELILEPGKDTLEIKCSHGKISMQGNSLLADPKKFFQPVNDWITEYIKDPAQTTEITLRFEYMDTASIQAIFDLLMSIKVITKINKQLVVNWYFEFDDPELLEVGEIMSGRLKLDFNYIEYTL